LITDRKIVAREKYTYRFDRLIKSGVRRQAYFGELLKGGKNASCEVANKLIQKIHSEIF